MKSCDLARRRYAAGFTLVELVAALAISTMVLGILGGILWQFTRTPEQQSGRLVLQEEMRRATTWLRLDANKAQSFETSTSPTYGTFRWLDFSTYPPTRRKVVYFWEESDVPNPSASVAPFNYGILYRQPYTEGVSEPKIPLIRHVATSTDITVVVTTAPHYAVSTSDERVLTVNLTSSFEGGILGQLRETTELEVELRPEQLNPQEYLYFFPHNNPTPPTGNTNSQTTLPMDFTQPTATTLYNYDANRDSDPGLLVRKSSVGCKIDFEDTKTQDWLSDALAEAMTIDGRSSLFLSLAAESFLTGKLISLCVWLRDFDPATDTYTLIVQLGEPSFNSVGDWSSVSLHFRPTVYTVPQGHKLALRIKINGKSDSDLMLAYDTTTYLALLAVPTKP